MSAQVRTPLHEVMQWPELSVRTMQAFFAREPAGEERAEAAIAHLSAIYVSAHSKKGAPQKRISDFLLFSRAWERTIDATWYSPEDIKTMAALGLRTR